MARIRTNDIDIEYESYGNERDPAVLLIMGLGAQLTLWPMEFVDALVAKGFRVIRYDNRDVGLSTKFEHAKVPRLPRLVLARMIGLTPATPYTLSDMAEDAVCLLEALGIPAAHVVGASMGGMIAQLVAANHPDKVLSLTSIMSTTGNPRLPRARKEAMEVLTKRPQTGDMDALVAHGVRAAQVISGPGYPVDPVVLAERVRASIERSNYPAGFQRQLAAIVADGDRRKRLARITAPTVIIHGVDDPLVPREGGQDTARHIPGARLVEIPKMGHNVPLQVIPEVVDAIMSVARPGAAR